MKETMQSIHHKRIDAVFEGKYPEDRFPICEQAFASSVATKIFGRPMLTGSTELHFQESLAWLKGDAAHEDFLGKLYQDTIELHRFFDYDIFFLPWRLSAKPIKQIDDFTIAYGNPGEDGYCVRQFDPVSRTYGITESKELDPDGVIGLLKKNIELRNREKFHPELNPMLAKTQKEYGSEFVVAGGSGMAVPMQAGWLEASILEPGLFKEWMQINAEDAIASIEIQHKAGIKIINGGGDFAFNNGPVYSPAFFDEVMAPQWKRIFDFCRKLGVYYVMRSDGNLWPVAESLFTKCRPHAYYEIDYDAGMRFNELRKAFPELVLFGNVSCDLLINGTVDEIREKTMKCLEAAAPRYVGASANSILHGTPTENVFALYDTVKRYKIVK
ncbi:MAG: hypothetical protein A2017_01605 [Lentisphaerae bacterium GWF2_44_16]|nr:MAG: hypothetical protein A2017_01605 [Lentisphaerae bacterium GWF2_44_16]